MQASLIQPTLFLDIDGVLNSHEYWRRRMPRSESSSPFPSSYELDPLAVARLSRVVAATGAKVVISSIWRILSSPEDILRLLREVGYTGGVAGETPIHNDRRRWPEIADYLNSMAESAKWAAIDDEDIRRDGCPSDRFAHTSMEGGMLDEHAERLISILS